MALSCTCAACHITVYSTTPRHRPHRPPFVQLEVGHMRVPSCLRLRVDVLTRARQRSHARGVRMCARALPARYFPSRKAFEAKPSQPGGMALAAIARVEPDGPTGLQVQNHDWCAPLTVTYVAAVCAADASDSSIRCRRCCT